MKAGDTVGLILGILMVVPSGFGIVGLIMSIVSLMPWIIFSVMGVIRLRSLTGREDSI
jgi:hypothetical protein